MMQGSGVTASLQWPVPPNSQTIPIFTCQVEKSYSHDPAAFTQGLVFAKDHYFEGTGLYGLSDLRKVDLTSGKVLERLPLPRHLFGEGVTLAANRIYQLTWKSHEVRVYDLDPIKLSAQHFWPYQGWGITSYKDFLVISDGTDRLFFVDPDKFIIKSEVIVREGEQPLPRLNELESVDSYILANVWRTSRIAVIIPESGQVAAWIDLASIAEKEPAGVPNGIAWDSANRRLFVTGKKWSRIYEVTLKVSP